MFCNKCLIVVIINTATILFYLKEMEICNFYPRYNEVSSEVKASESLGNRSLNPTQGVNW